jgi:pimeloyl-ACP methyl ester carboxylesterase
MRGSSLLSVAVGVVTLAACSTSADVHVSAPPTNAESPSTESPGTTPAPPGTGGSSEPSAAPVDWGSCRASDFYDVQGWQCGSIEVPLDYGDADGQTIEIALTRHPASDDASRLGSLVVNPGGPGASGIDVVHGLLDQLPDEVASRFDVVGFDPRGVGQSTAIDCITDKQMDAAADLDPTPDTAAEIDAIVDQLSSTAGTCAAEQGPLLAHLGTMSSARDLDRIREAVGDEKLTYLGFSYGTSLGATYADLFPDKVRALVLDGVVDPAAGEGADGEPSKEQFYGSQDFGGALDSFAAACRKVSSCSAGPDPQKLIDEIRGEVEKAPVAAKTVEAEDGRRLSIGLFETGVNFALYDASFWPFLAVGLRDAANGDGSALIRLADEYNERSADGTWGSIAQAFRAITCADFAGRPTADEAKAAYEEVAGTEQETSADGPNPSCLDWEPTVEPLVRVGPADTPPILVVGTKGDPATPYANTAAMAKALGNGVVLTWDGDGHTAFAGSSQCINDAVTSYLVDLKVPAEGTTCPAEDGGPTGSSSSGSEYSLDRTVLSEPIEEALKMAGQPAAVAACAAKTVSEDLDETEPVHYTLGLDQAGLTRAVRRALNAC